MPTYVYACKSCGHGFEQHQSFSEDALTTCPACGQEALRKVFNSVGIVFKGSGFYKTDSRSGSGTGSASAGTPASGPAEGTTGAGTSGAAGTGTTAAPASSAAAPAESSSSTSPAVSATPKATSDS